MKKVEAKYVAPATDRSSVLAEKKSEMDEAVKNYVEQDYPDSAELYLNHLLEINPNDKLYRSYIYLNLGIIYEMTSKFSKAYLSYRTALNLNPRLDDAQSGLDRTNQLSLSR